MYFGMAGCNNDITVFDSSPLHGIVADRTYPRPAECTINGVMRNKSYWIADSLYAKAQVIVLKVLNLATERESYYANRQ